MTTAHRVAATLLTLGLLTSCGGDADTGSDPSPTPTTAEQTSEAPTDTGSTSDDSEDSTDDSEDSTDDTTDDTADAAAVTMTITGFAFEVPDSVAPGAEITVTNEDSVGHTVTSDDDGATFDVTVGAGETVTFTAPDEAGEFPFHCRPHPNMTATLVVEG